MYKYPMYPIQLRPLSPPRCCAAAQPGPSCLWFSCHVGSTDLLSLNTSPHLASHSVMIIILMVIVGQRRRADPLPHALNLLKRPTGCTWSRDPNGEYQRTRDHTAAAAAAGGENGTFFIWIPSSGKLLSQLRKSFYVHDRI